MTDAPKLLGAEIEKFREYVAEGKTFYHPAYMRRVLATIDDLAFALVEAGIEIGVKNYLEKRRDLVRIEPDEVVAHMMNERAALQRNAEREVEFAEGWRTRQEQLDDPLQRRYVSAAEECKFCGSTVTHTGWCSLGGGRRCGP